MWTDDQRELVAQLVRDARHAVGLTQKELAELASVSEQTLQNLERGNQGSYRERTLARVANALGWRSDAIDVVVLTGSFSPDLLRDATPNLLRKAPINRDLLVATGGAEFAERTVREIAYSPSTVVLVVDNVIDRVRELREVVGGFLEDPDLGVSNRKVIIIKIRELADEFREFADGFDELASDLDQPG